MKRIRQIAVLCLSLLAGVCAGCSDDDIATVPWQKHAEGSIVLHIGMESRAQTRTTLAGSYNLHNVSQVYAILYEGTGDDATYVCHQDLMWSPKDSTDYSEGVVQEKAFEFEVPSTLRSGKECTLLCVGLDDLSGTTYGLTLDADQAPSFLTAGKTLADAKATLATGGTMTKSELFAGWESFTYNRNEDEDDEDANTVEVELTRRVAGAYAYLKDIPIQVNGTDVKYIQWVLGNSPTTEIGLARVERTADNTLPDDFGSGANTAADATVLDKLTLADIATANSTTKLYDIKEDYTTARGLSEQTLLLSAYLLPMKYGTNGTLAVQLLDGSGNLIKSFPAQWTDMPTAAGSSTTCYSIYPNYVYHAGTRSADSDRPASLAGDRIELVAQPWEKVPVDTEFPKVPLEATIDYDKNPSSYIYDCINTTDQITIMPSLLKRAWTLTLAAEDDEGNIDLSGTCDWIYFVKSDGSYTQTLTSSDYTGGNEQAVTVTIRLNDYVVKRTFNYNTAEGRAAINSDWRRARIVLTTAESSSSSYISIRQYNAITVYVAYDKTEYPRGFSRYDYGVERDKDGNVTKQGHLGYWGFWKTIKANVYDNSASDKIDYDGEFVYSETNKRDAIWGTDDTPLAGQPIIRYSKQDAWEWNGTANTWDSRYWYLPAQYELYKFFYDVVVHQPDIETHIYYDPDNTVPDYVYWSSTVSTSASIYYYAFCQALTAEGSLYFSEGEKKGSLVTRRRRSESNNAETANYGYSRRARHFD